MTCQWSSIRIGSLPMRSSASSWTAVRTVAALPSTTGSPQPTTPSSVSTRQKSQRGGTAKVSTRAIFKKVLQEMAAAARLRMRPGWFRSDGGSGGPPFRTSSS